MKFEMDFINGEARERWKKTSVRNRLRELATKGVIERMAGDEDEVPGLQSSSWRWVAEVAGTSLDVLATSAETVGLGVVNGSNRADGQFGRCKLAAMFEHLLHDERLLDESAFLERTGWSARELVEATRTGEVFALIIEGTARYPEFFADARYDREQLGSVSKALGSISAGSKWQFLTTVKASIARATAGEGNGTARTPLQALADGDVDLVVRAARGFAER